MKLFFYSIYFSLSYSSMICILFSPVLFRSLSTRRPTQKYGLVFQEIQFFSKNIAARHLPTVRSVLDGVYSPFWASF